MPEDSPSRNKCPGSTFAVRSVAQLPTLTRRQQMEVSCSIIGRSQEVRCCLLQRWRRCNYCGSDTPLRELRVGDTFQDRREPGHQDAAASGTAAGQQLPQSSQPVPPGDPLDDSPRPNCPTRGITLTERDKQVLVELRWASAMALRDAWSLATPRLGQRVPKEPRAVTSPVLCAVACFWVKSLKEMTGTPS